MDTFLELVSMRLLRWLLVGVAALFVLVPDAFAQDFSRCHALEYGSGSPAADNIYCPSREEAYQAADQVCEALAQAPCSFSGLGSNMVRFRKTGTVGWSTHRWWPVGSECTSPDGVWNDTTMQCDEPCADKPPLTSGWLACPDSNTINCPYNACVDSCQYSQDTLPDTATQHYRQVDGIWYASVSGYGPTGATCTVGSDPSLSNPPTDTDGDGVSDANDTFPNDPGESVDSDGDGIGDNADFAPDDPTDGKDTPGDEDGDDEGDNAASGGGTCVSPPMCVGDGILCAIAFQTWATRCAAEKIAANTSGDGSGGSGGEGGENNGSATAGSGNCQVAPACSGGDAAQCALLLQQWRLACDSGDPEADTSGITETADGEVEGDPEGLFETQGWAEQVQEVQSNANGWAGRGSCPVSFTFSALGRSFDMDPTAWCDLMDVLAALVNLVAAIHAGFILASGLRRG